MFRADVRAIAHVLALAAAVWTLAGCEKAMKDMYDQPRYKPLAASTLWRDGAASRPPTLATLRRGRERYDIYCAPCHSVAGDGDGMIVRRGFPAPPSFHTPRLRDASDEYLRSVIRNGYGAMYSYATRVDAADEIAIVDYVRALQLSRAATLDDVPDAARATLR